MQREAAASRVSMRRATVVVPTTSCSKPPFWSWSTRSGGRSACRWTRRRRVCAGRRGREGLAGGQPELAENRLFMGGEYGGDSATMIHACAWPGKGSRAASPTREARRHQPPVPGMSPRRTPRLPRRREVARFLQTAPLGGQNLSKTLLESPMNSPSTVLRGYHGTNAHKVARRASV